MSASRKSRDERSGERGGGGGGMAEARTTIFARKSLSVTPAFGDAGRFRTLPAGLGDFGVEGGFGAEAFLLATGRQMMAWRDWRSARRGMVDRRVERGEATRWGKSR